MTRLARAWHAGVFALALLAAAPAAGAQDGRVPAADLGRPRGERLERALRRRLGLTDDQVMRLRASTRAYAPRRFALGQRERAVADSLRAELAAARRNEALVGGLIGRLFEVRRARLDLREREQRDLAAFLTPSQRAMLLGLEEQAQRRAAGVRAARRPER